MRHLGLSIRTRRFTFFAIFCLGVILSLFLGTRAWPSTPAGLSLGQNFTYLSTETTGCQGSFCIEKVNGETHHYYATNLSLDEVASLATRKGVKQMSKPWTTISNGVSQTMLYLEHDGYLIYYSLPDQKTRDLYGKITGKPVTKEAVVQLADVTARELAE